jgi:hypothetical protein
MHTKIQIMSLHAYVAGCENEFLAEVFEPVLDAMEAPVAAFFFLRYWRGGPHLRLRVRGSQVQCQFLQKTLRVRFAQWCATNPKFQFPSAEDHAPLARKFALLEACDLDDTLVNVPMLVESDYHPESTKYGGDAGLAIAEKVWRSSSAVVLEANRAGLLGSEKRHSVGLQMALVALQAFGLGLDEAQFFFGACAGVWQRYCPGQGNSKFESRLAAQAEDLIPVIAAVWQQRRPPLLDGWHADMTYASSRILEKAQDIAVAINYPDQNTCLPASRAHHYLLSQFVHTNNNRLGITPIDEWFQARLAETALTLYLQSNNQGGAHARPKHS